MVAAGMLESALIDAALFLGLLELVCSRVGLTFRTSAPTTGTREVDSKQWQAVRRQASSARGALRGAEVQTMDLIFQLSTSEQLAALWKFLSSVPPRSGQLRGLAQKLARALIGDALHAAARGGHEDAQNDLLKNRPSTNAQVTTYVWLNPSSRCYLRGETEWCS